MGSDIGEPPGGNGRGQVAPGAPARSAGHGNGRGGWREVHLPAQPTRAAIAAVCPPGVPVSSSVAGEQGRAPPGPRPPAFTPPPAPPPPCPPPRTAPPPPDP